MLISAEHISKNYATKQLLSDTSLYLSERDKLGIIGINGTGKSTLLKILAGEETPDAGAVIRGRGVRVSYLPQNPVMDDALTVLEQVLRDLPSDLRETFDYEVREMLARLGVTDPSARIGTLSGGQRKRAALASALIHPADVLILDEPTNHLDSDMTAWLEERLLRFSGAIIMVTHDRWFLERVAGRIAELSRGKLWFYEANYSKYLELRAERLDMEQASERKRQSVLRREQEWISRGARARGTKSKDRIERYYALKEQDAPQTDASVQMAAAASRMGRKLIELRGVSKAYGGRDVIRDFSYTVGRRDRIGVVGRNGAGKSTLLGLISGALAPDSGEVDFGATVKLGYFTQEGRELDMDMRVYDLINETAREVKTDEGTFSSAQMLERFLFAADLQRQPIGKLSGGERRRLYLLSILVSAPNILLLDEPTNDLDVETLAILEDYLDGFPGAVIAVSHDRWFLDKMADTIFEVTGDGRVERYIGGYTDYIAARDARAAEDPEKSEKASEAAPKRAPQNRPPQKLKMTFGEQREYAAIDDEIAALEAKLADCRRERDESSSDYAALMDCEQRLGALERELDEKTERWVYLSELAEKIAAQ